MKVSMMEKKQSCCCGGLPKGLWWLFTLLGLGLIYLLMFNSNKVDIESDLDRRASAALSAEGMDWATIAIEDQGRDISLSGLAPSDVAKTQAINLVQNISGVRVVSDQMTVCAADAGAEVVTDEASETTEISEDVEVAEVITPEDASLFIESDDVGNLVLRGVVANEEERDIVYKAAVAKMGEAKVVNELEVRANVKTLSGLGEMTALVSLLSDEGSLNIDASGLKYSGSVDSQSAMNDIIQTAESLLTTEGIPVLNNIIVDNVTDAGSSTVTAVDVEENAKELAKIEVEEKVERDAEAEIKAKELAKIEAEEKAKRDAEAEIKAKELAKIEAEEKAKRDAEMEAVLAKEAELAASAKCQSDLNSAMLNKSIHFRTNSATIKSESFDLLGSIANVMKACSQQISAKGITINGHTDSRGAESYNLSLSNRRAEAVKKYLVTQGVDGQQLKSIGHGESQPIADNSTKEGRAKNRRITFIIIH